MAANRRIAHLLDGMGAIFAPRPREHAYAYDSDSHHRPRPSRRPRRNTFDHDSRYQPAHVAPPDLHHLRQARAAYYAPPPPPDPRSARRPSAASVALSSHPPTPPPVPEPVPALVSVPAPDPEMEPKLTRAASTRKSSKAKRQPQQQQQQHDDRHPSRKEREDRDSGVYVYSTPRSGGSRSRREEDLADTRSRAGHRRAVSSPATNVIDVEVEREPEPEPEPVRRTDGVHLSRTMSSRDPGRPIMMTRPSLRRTGTLKTPPGDVPPPPSSQSHTRRNSGIFSLFRHVPPPAQTAEKKYDCMVCMDKVRASRCPRLACGHRMCHTCLKRQFELSVRDPQHMPPRCCTHDHIPLKYVERLFDTKFKILWNNKYQEYTAKNRIYCPTRGCGEWIKPSHIRMDTIVGRKYGKCPRCRGKVCVKCNGRWHLRKECPKDDEEANAFAEMAKESGWQKCYSCKAMVELKEGCNHMTCRCTAEFCMLCGSRWKTCECPWFNYQHLDDDDRLQNMRVPEPYVVVERDRPETAPAPPPPRPQQNATRPDQYAVPAPRSNHPVYVREEERPATSRTARTFYAPADRDLEREREREREDEMLARRLQSEFFADMDNSGLSRAGSHRRHHRHHHHRTASAAAAAAAQSRYDSPEIEVEVLGVGNASGHHMNDFGLPAQPRQPAPAPSRHASTIIRRSNTTTTRGGHTRRATADTPTRYSTATSVTPTAAPPGPPVVTVTRANSMSAQYQHARQQHRHGGGGGADTAAAAAAAVEASVMAGLGDPARSGMGRVGMWLNYVENDPAEVEGRAQRSAGAGAGMVAAY